jgi:heme/copper-type cytochrome/quinol oxidase subunit 2
MLTNFGRGVGALAVALAVCGAARAESAPIQLSLKDHLFTPAEITAPANQPVTIEISNQDATPAEFESKQLRVEKVVAGNSKITVQVRPLPPGRYRFYDDYHEKTTEGFLIVR